jgi:hypothetical protein
MKYSFRDACRRSAGRRPNGGTILCTALGLLAASGALSRSPTPIPRFGINYVYHGMNHYIREHGGSQQEYISHQNQKLRTIGPLWIRSAGRGDLTSLNWATLEPRNGVFDFLLHDARVRSAQSCNLTLLGNVDFSTVPDYARVKGQYFSDAEYLDYLRAIVERYDGDGKNDLPGLKNPILYWEIGNEVNNNPMFNGTAQDYAHVLKISYQSIKANAPGCFVLIGGWVIGALRDEARWQRSLAYLDDVLAAGGGRYFDIMNFHEYTDDCDFLTYYHVQGFKDKLKKYGLSKPIWITESNTKLRKEGHGLTVVHTLARQAQDIVKRIVVAFDAGVDVFFWHGLDDINDQDPGVGLYNEHEVPKPVYYDLKLLIDRLGRFSSVSRIDLGSDKHFFYSFRVNGAQVAVLWTEGPETRLNLSRYFTKSKLELAYAITKSGQTEPDALTASKNSVPATKTPVFITEPK